MVFKSEFQCVTIHFGHKCQLEFYTNSEGSSYMMNLYKQGRDFCVGTSTTFGTGSIDTGITYKDGAKSYIVNSDFIQMIDIEDVDLIDSGFVSTIEAL